MASTEQLFGEETSSSDSSEESSSEEEQQLQQQNGGKTERSSSSESEEESGSGSEQEETGQPAIEPISEDEAPETKKSSTTAQDLFGGESSSESSSESASNAEQDSIRDAASRSRSNTPKSGGSNASSPKSVGSNASSPKSVGSNTSSPKSLGDEDGGKDREGEAKGKVSQTMEGIFGDASDLSSSEDEGSGGPVTRRVHEEVDFGDLSDEPEGVLGDADERAEDEVEEEEEAPRINVDIPRCVAELGTDLHFVKLPNFLSVETRPFDSELYEDEGEDDDVLDEEGRARLKLKVENTIRWRFVQDEEGNEVRESNARVVRWTDGSMSLYLGSEIFDISKQPLQGEYSHLFVRQGTGLQGQAVFKNKVTFRPHSTDSQTHRKMTLSIADRFSKAQKIRVLPAVGKDPESQRTERIKKAEESLRLSVRQGQKKKSMEYSRNRKYGITASYLEPDREVDLEEDITAIKSAVRSRMGMKRGATEMSDASSEEEEELEERLTKAKDMRPESPPAKRPTRRSRGGGGGSDKERGGRKGVRSRKIISSSEEESD